MRLILPFFIAILMSSICLKGQVQNNGNLRMHAGSKIGLFGDFINQGNFSNNLGELTVAGSNPQTFKGTSIIHTNNFTINKTSNSLQLDNLLQIAEMLTFIKGSIQTDRIEVSNVFVEFLDNAAYGGESDSSHIDGVIRKTGNDAFVFPTGDHAKLRTIAITAPALVTDHFTAYYAEANPDDLYSRSSLDVDLHHVSACEYWILNRTEGSSNVAVTLSWDSNSCGVDNLCDLRVSRWDGAQWLSEGNGGVTGDEGLGTVVSGTSCSNPVPITSFSPFTLGSISSDNPLPIKLISFEALVCDTWVCLAWQTAAEVNNDFFTVEKSTDGIIWEDFVEVQGAGNSQTNLSYETVDKAPYLGLSYYRLKQTDFNGDFEYSSVELVNLENSNGHGLTMYPNPAKNYVTLKGLSFEVKNLKIYNLIGQDVTSSVIIIQNSQTNLQLDISLLKPGIYQVKISNNFSSLIKQ